MTHEKLTALRVAWWERLPEGDKRHLVDCVKDERLDDHAVKVMLSYDSPMGPPLVKWEHEPAYTPMLSTDFADFVKARPEFRA